MTDEALKSDLDFQEFLKRKARYHEGIGPRNRAVVPVAVQVEREYEMNTRLLAALLSAPVLDRKLVADVLRRDRVQRRMLVPSAVLLRSA